MAEFSSSISATILVRETRGVFSFAHGMTLIGTDDSPHFPGLEQVITKQNFTRLYLYIIAVSTTACSYLGKSANHF